MSFSRRACTMGIMMVLTMVLVLTLVGQVAAQNGNESADEDGDGSILGILGEQWENLKDEFFSLLPGLVFFIVILLIGYIIAKIVGAALAKLLEKTGFEAAMKKVRMDVQVKKLGFKSVSRLIGTLMFWFIFAMVIQVALDYGGIWTLTNVLTPIVLFIPRAIIAVIVVLLGFYVAELAVEFLRKYMKTTPLGKDLVDMDKKTKHSGMSVLSLAFIFVKVFILLIFLQVALEIVAISVLESFITPIILAIPLVLTAMAIILVGLIVTEYVVKMVLRLLREFEFHKLIRPVEKTIKRKGVVIQVLSFVLKIFIMLFFIQLAIGVLNQTGQFNMFAQLINDIILWIPNVVMAIFIGLFGFWLAGWVHDKVVVEGKRMDVPFISVIATGVKFMIIYIAAVMAMAQVGIEVPILYILFTIAAAAVFIGLGVGFAYGSKDVFHNMMAGVQSSQTLKPGQKVKIEDHSGTVENVGRYYLVLKTAKGKVSIPHARMVKAVIEETG